MKTTAKWLLKVYGAGHSGGFLKIHKSNITLYFNVYSRAISCHRDLYCKHITKLGQKRKKEKKRD